MNKKQQRYRFNEKLETMMSQIRFLHQVNNLKMQDVYNDFDPNFPGYAPYEDNSPNSAARLDLPPEFRKLYNHVNFP